MSDYMKVLKGKDMLYQNTFIVNVFIIIIIIEIINHL